MTTINTVSTATATSSTTTARTSLASNYETFLTLLTAQLKNQDPLSPMDSTEFTNQLVQFSGVEQQIETNDQLSKLLENSKLSTASTAVSFLGTEASAKTNSAGLVSGGTASWQVDLPRDAQTVTLKITDSNGRVVRTETGATTKGEKTFTWDGKDAAGRAAPTGTYKLEVNATGADGKAIAGTVSQRGVITGVDLSGSTATVFMAGTSIPLTSITKVGLQKAQ